LRCSSQGARCPTTSRSSVGPTVLELPARSPNTQVLPCPAPP
jgi:hypothetical protein